MKHLFLHLCNPKSSSRYSTTEALEHPWFTGSEKYPLSFDEGLLWNSLKRIFLCTVFAVQERENSKVTKINLHEITPKNLLTESKICEAQQRVNRRQQYSKKIRLMRINPLLYQAIYGDKVTSINLCFTPRKTLTSDKLPAIKLSTPKNAKPIPNSCRSLKITHNVLRVRPVSNFLNTVIKVVSNNKLKKKKRKNKNRIIKHATRNFPKTVVA